MHLISKMQRIIHTLHGCPEDWRGSFKTLKLYLVLEEKNNGKESLFNFPLKRKISNLQKVKVLDSQKFWHYFMKSYDSIKKNSKIFIKIEKNIFFKWAVVVLIYFFNLNEFLCGGMIMEILNSVWCRHFTTYKCIQSICYTFKLAQCNMLIHLNKAGKMIFKKLLEF